METPGKVRRRKSPIVFRNQDDDMQELNSTTLFEHEDNGRTQKNRKYINTPNKDAKTNTNKLISPSTKAQLSKPSVSKTPSVNKLNDSAPNRKSHRDRTMSVKYLESLANVQLDDTDAKENTCYDDNIATRIVDGISVTDIDTNNLHDQPLKPSELFEDNDVAGEQMFGFKTPKKKAGMAIKASGAPQTPATVVYEKLRGTTSGLITPSRRGTQTAKTPHQERNEIKKRLSYMTSYKDDRSGEDFSESESDFAPGTESGSSTTDDESSILELEDAEEDKIHAKFKLKPANKLRPRNTNRKDHNYILKSDNYFSSHSGGKTVTSDHTLDRLKNPRLPQDRIHKLLQAIKCSTDHETALSDMSTEYCELFFKWKYILNEGFSILLYGLGSKRILLQTFHRESIPKQPVIVVNGFFPSLTIKEIVDNISNGILDLSLNMSNIHEIVDRIEEEFAQIPDIHLFLIVHNIDGPMLRNTKAQSVLARLAKVTNIHLLASIDHINTPLIWDHSKLSSFNFSWWDVTSMLPYAVETSYESSLMVQNSGALALSSLKNVFLSLTSNCKGIYLLIVKNQLANKSNQNYQGIAFKDLYSACREVFLVSSDSALRAHLTEFLDHKLIKSRRTADGIEHLIVTIENSLLNQFLEQQQ